MVDGRERESIRAGLTSSDEEVRRLAVERLAALPEEEALPDLLGALGDSSWRVRKTAVTRLAGVSEARRAHERLVEALADGENPGRRNAALEALVASGPPAVPALLGASEDPDTDVRKLAVDGLAGIGDERARPRLVEMLRDPDPNVRSAAADALGALGGEDSARALVRVAASPDEDRLVAFSALRALERLESPVPPQVLEPALAEPMLRPAAFAVLGCTADDASVETLLKGLAAPSRAAREAAMRALLRVASQRDGAAVAALVERIRSAATASPELVADAVGRLAGADLSTRLVLIQFLGLLGEERCVVPILRVSRDEALAEVGLSTLASFGAAAERAVGAAWAELASESQLLACDLLGRTSGEEGQARLLAALDSDDIELRTAAARALGRRCCADALRALVRRLATARVCEDDPEAEEELAATSEAIVRIAEPRGPGDEGRVEQTVVLLGARIEEAPEPVRVAVASVLGRIGRPQDAELIAFLLKDPSPHVRRSAVHALARIECGADSEPVRLALADESPSVRIAAATALGVSARPQVLEDLAHLAADEDPHVRAAAVRAVGARALRAGGDERRRAFEALAGALEEEGPVVLAALETLRELGERAAVRAVAPLLASADPEIVQAAAACIAVSGERGDLEALFPLISHPHWAVRAEAIQALADRRVIQAVPAILRRLEMEQDDFARATLLGALRVLEG